MYTTMYVDNDVVASNMSLLGELLDSVLVELKEVFITYSQTFNLIAE